MDDTAFKKVVWNYYNENKREMPWRHTDNPYYVFVSEVMLQQTQVPRVTVKFREFISRFPILTELAQASLADVLQVWQGLGYNRRALWLLESAKTIHNTHKGLIPKNVEQLAALKGIGKNTAAAIVVYAFNQPVVFVETNIRTVFIHHFFTDASLVSDLELRPIVERTLDRDNPRDWYYALMDYGTYLKGVLPNANSLSKDYRKQSALRGSVREVRGAIIKALSEHPSMSYDELFVRLQFDRERFDKAVQGLIRDRLLLQNGAILKL